MNQIDILLFYALHSLSGANAWMDRLIVFTGDYLLYAVLAVVAWYLWRAWQARDLKTAWGYIVAGAAALIARFAVAEAIRLFYHRARPFDALGVPHLLNDSAYSFPSGHTIFIFALATGIYKVNKALAWWLYAVGALIGLARVAGGVHYPSDILGGAVLGVATGWAAAAVARRFFRYSL